MQHTAYDIQGVLRDHRYKVVFIVALSIFEISNHPLTCLVEYLYELADDIRVERWGKNLASLVPLTPCKCAKKNFLLNVTNSDYQ